MPIPEMQRLHPFGKALESQKIVLKHEEGPVAAGEYGLRAVERTSSWPSSELLHFPFPAPDNLLCLLTGC